MPESRPEVANFAAAKWSSPRECCGMCMLGGISELLDFRLQAGPLFPSVNFLDSGIVFYIKRYWFTTVLEDSGFRCICVIY